MEQLNDDVLILIFEKLSVKDQASVALTSYHFYDIISSLWRRGKRISLHEKAGLNCVQYSTLIGGICNTVQSILLRRLTLRKWHIIKQYSYPNVTRLKLRHPDISNDGMTLKMTELFPNLRSVSLRNTRISGKHIEKWQYLDEFDFSGRDNFEFEYFENILEKLNLKKLKVEYFFRPSHRTWTSEVAFKKFCNLEEISLGPDNQNLIKELPHCPNLKVLNLTNFCTSSRRIYLLVNIVKCVAKNNDSVTIRKSEYHLGHTKKVMVLTGLANLKLSCFNVKHFININKGLIRMENTRVGSCAEPV